MSLEFPITDAVLQFTLFVTAALVVQLTVERLRLPGLIGLLIIGMLIGPDGLAVLPHGPVVELLGSIGLLYIMFLAGLEIDLGVVKAHKREATGFGLLAFLLSLVLAVGVGLFMGYGWIGAVLLGAALSSHTLLAYPIIERLQLIHRRPVVATIGGTLLTDTLALVLLAVMIQQAGGGEEAIWGWWGPLALLAVLTGFSLLVIPRSSRLFFQKAGAKPAEDALFVLTILMLLSTAAELIGTENILGAFIAGVCLNRPLKNREGLHEHLEFVGRMLFIPFFFIETGMRLELEVFTSHPRTWTLAGLLLGVVVLGKSAASWISGWMFGYARVGRAVMIGLSLPQAAATLAVVVTARNAGLFDSEVVDAIIIVIFVTCLLGPLLTRFAGKRLAEQDATSEEQA